MAKNKPQDFIESLTDKLTGIYRGVVEDTIDPLKLGRCKIRVFGIHTPNKIKDSINGIPTDDLPWSEPALGLFEGSVSGFGAWTVPLPGSHVFVFFENGHILKCKYFASIPGIPTDVNHGFTDKQGFSDPNNVYPIETSVAPHKPNQLNESDFHRLAKGTTTDTIVESKNTNRDLNVSYGSGTWSEPESFYNATYPDNKVIATHSGITIELDDTVNNERIHVYHPSNSYFEYDKNGQLVNKNASNRFVITGGSKNEHTVSNNNLTVSGNKNLKIIGNDNSIIGGNKNLTVGGTEISNITGNKTITTPNVYLNSTLTVLNATTLQSTLNVTGHSTLSTLNAGATHLDSLSVGSGTLSITQSDNTMLVNTFNNDVIHRTTGTFTIQASAIYFADSQFVPDNISYWFFQDDAPTVEQGVGDYWIDTNDKNKTYRWDGLVWVDVSDTDIALAIQNASTAQSTADGKVVTYLQDTAPTAEGEGDLWFDTDDENRIYRWSGSVWEDIQDEGISLAIAASATAQSTADGKIYTFYATSPPTSGSEGDLWFDTDEAENTLYRWDASETYTPPLFKWVLVQDKGITDAIALAEGAQSTADGKIVSFYQTESPATSASNLGDLWFDTNDNNNPYRYSGSVWISVQDGDIATAISAASGAQATADGKVTTFYQAAAPTAEGEGDLWVDTDDGNKLYRWSGSAWISIQDDGINDAIEAASTADGKAELAQSTADGKIVSFYQTTEPGTETPTPSVPVLGDLWIDTDSAANELYRYSGSAWILVQDKGISDALSAASTAQSTADGKIVSFYQATEPTGGESSIGDIWIDTTDSSNTQHRYSGSAWVEIQDAEISQAISAASTAQSTADGKIVSFYQAAAPTAEGTGDIWIDTDDDNTPYRWSGSAWVSAVNDTADWDLIYGDIKTGTNEIDGTIVYNGSLGTLTLASNAVTVPISSYSDDGWSSTTGADIILTYATVTIAQPGTIIAMASVSERVKSGAKENVAFKIYSGTGVGGTLLDTFYRNNYDGMEEPVIDDGGDTHDSYRTVTLIGSYTASSSGTYTVGIYWASDGGGSYVDQAQIVVQGVMR